MSHAGGTFAALQSRNFRLFFLGHFISSCGTWLQIVVQRWLVWSLTHNELDLGVVAAATYSTMLVFSFVAGGVADRYDRRKIVLITQTAALLLAALLGLLALSPDLRVWEVAAVAAALGAVNAFDLPARHALVAELVEREVLVGAVALHQTIFNGARIIGPALAAVLLALPHVKFADCFFLNAISYVAVLIALWRIRLPCRARATEVNSPLAAILDGLRYALRTPAVGQTVLLVTVVGIFGWSALVLLPSMAQRALGGDDKLFAILMTVNGLGALSGTFIVARTGDRISKQRLIFGGLIVWCLALAAFSFARWTPLAVVLIGVAGVGMIVFSTTCNAVLQTTVPEALRGRVMALWTMMFAVAEPIGSIQAGAMARQLGPAITIRIGAAAMAVGGIIAYRIARRRKRDEEG